MKERELIKEFSVLPVRSLKASLMYVKRDIAEIRSVIKDGERFLNALKIERRVVKKLLKGRLSLMPSFSAKKHDKEIQNG